MLEYIDSSILYFFNVTISNSFFDKIFSHITNMSSWVLLYIWGFAFLIHKYKLKGFYISFLVILSIILADQISAGIIKDAVGRIRPCHIYSWVHIVDPCGAGKSFPSAHATNNFAVAYILSYFFPNYNRIYYILAGLIAFSRVYLGVHYPSDVIGGAILGICISFCIIFVYNFSINKKNNSI